MRTLARLIFRTLLFVTCLVVALSMLGLAFIFLIIGLVLKVKHDLEGDGLKRDSKTFKHKFERVRYRHRFNNWLRRLDKDFKE